MQVSQAHHLQPFLFMNGYTGCWKTCVGRELHHMWREQFEPRHSTLPKRWINAHEYVMTVPRTKSQSSRHPFATEQCQHHRNWTYIEHTPPVKNWRLLSQIGQKINMIVVSYSVSLLNSWAVAVWLQSSGVASRLQSLQVESREMERSQVPWKLSNSLRCRAPNVVFVLNFHGHRPMRNAKIKRPKGWVGTCSTKCAGYELIWIYPDDFSIYSFKCKLSICTVGLNLWLGWGFPLSPDRKKVQHELTRCATDETLARNGCAARQHAVVSNKGLQRSH